MVDVNAYCVDPKVRPSAQQISIDPRKQVVLTFSCHRSVLSILLAARIRLILVIVSVWLSPVKKFLTNTDFNDTLCVIS